MPCSDTERKHLYIEAMARKSTSKRAAGLKAKKTIIAQHGSEYYARIGKIGGSRTDTKPKGFEADRALARRAGAKGGAASRRSRA